MEQNISFDRCVDFLARMIEKLFVAVMMICNLIINKNQEKK